MLTINHILKLQPDIPQDMIIEGKNRNTKLMFHKVDPKRLDINPHFNLNGFQNFQDATNGKFRVVIVVGYRQLWNWLPSRKNEWEKKGSKESPTRPLSPVEATTLPWNVSAAKRRPVAARPFFMAATLAKNDDGHFFGTIGTLQQ